MFIHVAIQKIKTDVFFPYHAGKIGLQNNPWNDLFNNKN